MSKEANEALDAAAAAIEKRMRQIPEPRFSTDPREEGARLGLEEAMYIVRGMKT